MEHAKADDEGLTVADVSELFFVPRELAASLLETSEQDLDNLLSGAGIARWPLDPTERFRFAQQARRGSRLTDSMRERMQRIAERIQEAHNTDVRAQVSRMLNSDISEEELYAKALAKTQVREYVTEWLSENQVPDSDWVVGSDKTGLIMLNFGCAPAIEGLSDVWFNIEYRVHFLRSLVTHNRHKRIVILEAFSKACPRAMQMQDEMLKTTCSELKLLYCTEQTGNESVIYITGIEQCGGDVTATRVDTMGMEVGQKRPAWLFKEKKGKGVSVLAKHARSNGSKGKTQLRRADVLDFADTLLKVQASQQITVIGVADANMQFRDDGELLDQLRQKGIILSPQPTIDEETKALHPFSNVHCGDPDSLGKGTQLYDLCMSTFEVDADIFQLPHVLRLRQDLWYFVAAISSCTPDGADPDAWARLRWGCIRKAAMDRVVPDHHVLTVTLGRGTSKDSGAV